ncbi:hypothetical protein GCM10010174_76070 [Kutzneria viridogrisea]|uniref:long-chain-fatty-acyl-CoA reductase n=1 Tax=Kutzneria viridogrisea TaxID=47990 RepID=A0ABR6BNB3_9PSEU|nr:phenylacetate-coenzyme A ligase PaaK-like adenylate-forming protein [Kutzneria viridogrisea]
MTESQQHFWQGEWIDDAEADRRLDRLDELVQPALAQRLSPLVVVSACALLAELLSDVDSPARGELAARLRRTGVSEAEVERTFADLVEAMGRESLERKLTRELGGTDPGRLARADFRAEVFEAWVPVGVLAHVAPGNAPAAGAMSVVEGLLAGNVNVVKTSGEDPLFTHHLLAALADQDPTGRIARRLVVLRFSSARTDWLARMCAPADAVAAWGGEEALAGVAEHVRPGCRLVDWGPKLSFAYLTADSWSQDEQLRGVAEDICRLDQQACSSPQVIYLDTESPEDLFAFSERFARVLAATVVEPGEPGAAERAEITSTVLLARLEEHLGLTRVHAAPDGSWHVLADTRPALRASPLYRTVWVKPLPRKDIVRVLRPMRRYLQTVGIGASRPDLAELTRAVLTAGAQRVTALGGMLGSYDGEPHDGVYALQRYSRRVDVQLDERFAEDASLDDLLAAEQLPAPRVPITPKDRFEQLQRGSDRAEVFFRSGGSSGAPKLSAFSWDDYREHMRFGAEGLLAAGLRPGADRTMNLFFGGQLYGGFTSFFSVLETMGAVQLPMAAHEDHAAVAKSIVDNRVNTLLGMPNYLLRVFAEGAEPLRAYRGVRKVFFGGEQMPRRQRDWLREEFGVEVIRSAAYGSADAGPLGYQCPHCPERVHHLFTGIQTLEILDVAEDRPVAVGQTGRLVFTAHTRRGQRLDRYEIGDLGRWVDGACGCGRRSPRFELLGRFGDVFRSGTYFLNYRRFTSIAEDALDYSGAVQVVLEGSHDGETLRVRLERGKVDPGAATEALLAGYPDLNAAVTQDRTLALRVEPTEPEAFDRTPGSGKLLAVIDNR